MKLFEDKTTNDFIQNKNLYIKKEIERLSNEKIFRYSCTI